MDAMHEKAHLSAPILLETLKKGSQAMLRDDLLVNKCLAGDRDAFGMLVDRYKDAVYGLAYSKVRNLHDAEICEALGNRTGSAVGYMQLQQTAVECGCGRSRVSW